MRRLYYSLFFIILSLGIAANAAAQQFYICQGGNTSTTNGLNFTDGGATINGQYATSQVDSITVDVPGLRFVGGDISLLPSYCDNGAQYKTHDGTLITTAATGDARLQQMLQWLKQQGWNTMRVRLFVNPANASDTDKGQGVCQDLAYVTRLAKAIKQEGLLLMLDFHYSDSWADPAKQWTPKAWLGLNDAALGQQVYSYTKECLQTLVQAGAVPDFIQTGNEISYGMLWGAEGTIANRCTSGSDNGWARFTTLLKQAGQACRELCPRAKIILHTERVAKTSVMTNFYQKMQQAGVDYDIIGLSYYPYYHGYLNQLNTALTLLERYFPTKRIQVVETGYCAQYSISGDYNYTSTYPNTDEGQRKFTADLITTLKQHARVNGLSWWMAEANECGLDWKTRRVTDGWYNASLFSNETGRAWSALTELKNFR